MKNKVLFILAVTIVLVTTLAVSASAYTITETGSIIKSKEASATQIPEMVAVFEKQVSLGYIPTDTKLLCIGYDTDVGYMRATGVRGEYSAVTATATGSYVYYNTSSKILVTYAWTDSGWFYENVNNIRVQVRTKMTYSAIPAPAATYPAIDGYDLSRAGSADVGAVSVNAYYTQLCDIVINYEADIEEAEQNGYEIGLDDGYDAGYAAGYQTGQDDTHDTAYSNGYMDGIGEGFTQGYTQGKTDGKAECESTHLTLQEQAYDDGYDMGQEMCARTHDTIRQAGYDNGLYDCEQTHEAMKREQYEEGWSEGHATGVNEGYDNGYNDGYETGYDEGYDAHAGAKEIELKKQYDDGYSAGKEVGYTEAINSGDVVIEYVDGLFSAPIDFLYGAFNIEILGVNLFNLFMLLLSILIVGGVLLLVFKFR